MTAVYIVTIVFTSVILIIAIIAGTILAGFRLRHGGGFTATDKKARDEETRMIQEFHQDLARMETRIEALETILMENFGKDRP